MTNDKGSKGNYQAYDLALLPLGLLLRATERVKKRRPNELAAGPSFNWGV
jgi:hypothetical protein